MNRVLWWHIRILIVLLGVGGCVETASEPQENFSFTGGWSSARNGCEQRLVLEDSGRFTLSARYELSGGSRLEQTGGMYTQLEAQGTPLLVFTPDDEIDPDALLYCGQWLGRQEIALESGNAEIDVTALDLRTEISSVLGSVTIGTDSAQADRYAIYQRSDGRITEVMLTDPDPVAHPLYRTGFSDPNHDIATVNAHTAVNLPHGSWRDTFTSVSAGNPVAKIVLNIASATELNVAAIADTGLPPCNYDFYTDPDFTVVESSYVFVSGQASNSVQLNPGDPGAFFYTSIVTVNGESATAYLIPLEFTAPASGDCAVSIRGRSLVLPLLEKLQQQNDPALATYFPGGGPARLTRLHGSNSSRLMFDGIPLGMVTVQSRLHPVVASVLPLAVEADGSPPAHDQIGLLAEGDMALRPRIAESGQHMYLDLFPESGSSQAVGPLRALADHAGVNLLAVPSTTSLRFSSGQQARFHRFELQGEERVGLWTAGGVELAGELYTESGLDLARSRGGAPDGTGFYMVRTLGAGTYLLAVRRLGTGSDYTLHLDSAAGFVFDDDGLAECLIEAGWLQGQSITELNCSGRGVETLTGLESVTTLISVALDANGLTDISAVQSLSELREIALGSNQVADISPLAGLTNLERLGLGGNPLDSDALSVLGGMSTLTHLDLRGVPTITRAQANGLKQTLPDTLIVTPAGKVLE